MCGITASLLLQGQTPPSKESLEKEIDAGLAIIKHRGPDAEGQWISPNARVGLGHVRLSIIDLAPTGNQPFHSSTNRIHGVVNGEIYDHDRLREELRSEYDFVGHSDSEIPLALYQHYGLSLMPHLRGEFAFVLWDSEREVFFAARDRYGIKPLYYTVVNGRLLVATEIKSFLAFGWKPEWDVQALVDHGWRTDGRTMFKGVRKVLPGHYLISKHYGPVEEKPYWDIEYPNKHVKETRTEAEMIQGVQDRMLESVRLRLRADVPVGIYLSGGLDSSAIAGMIAHVLKEGQANLGNDSSKDLTNMTALCVQFDKDSGADESEIAKRTAEWLGVKFVPILMNDEALAQNFEDAAWFSETVMPDANGPGRLAMAAFAHKQGLKVVLTGEGSDEHFGGYSAFTPEAIREADPSWPSSDFPESERLEALRAAEARPDLNFGGEVGSRPESTSRMLNGSIQTRRLATLTPAKWASWTDRYTDRNQETLMVESFDGRVREAIATKWHPLHTAQYIHTKTAFPNLLLRYVGDNVDMVHRIESRTPFLDHHVTEYANGLPPSLKMKYDPATKTFNEKYVLKEAMKPFIPGEIYNRKKHSFVGPTRYPDGPFKDLLKKLITKENIEQLGFLDWEQTSELIGKAFEGKDSFAMRGAMVAAQFVVLGKRFGVAKASPELVQP